MKLQTLAVAVLIGIAVTSLFSSCESCARKTAKKVTDLSMSVIEGVSESISEHGEKASEKMTDALGAILKGASKSIDNQLNEHAEHVASVTGRTFVQLLDGLEDGLLTEYYDTIPHEDDFISGISLQKFGKIKNTSVLDAYFVIQEQGIYTCQFDFLDADGNVVLQREATIEKLSSEKTSVVSIALNEEEEALFGQSEKTRIKVVAKE